MAAEPVGGPAAGGGAGGYFTPALGSSVFGLRAAVGKESAADYVAQNEINGNDQGLS